MNSWEFLDILVSLREKLQEYTSWAKVFFYGVIDSLLKVVAWTFEQLKVVTDIYFRESRWSQAQLLKSLAQLSDPYLSYTIDRAKGAAGNVVVSADSTFSSTYTYTGYSVPINRWTRFTNEDQNVFVYSTEDKTYSKNLVGNLTVPVKEGIPKTYTYRAEGIEDEEISIVSNKIENDEIEIFIIDDTDAVVATVNICGEGDNAEKLFFVNDTTNYYCEVNNAYDFQSVKIKFGDGITARKLTAGERVLIKYAETEGEDGNVSSQDIITVISDTLTDINDNDATLYVNNEEEISGGEVIETLEHVRNYAPRLFYSGYRASGYNDYITLLEDHPFINKAIIDVDTDDPVNFNKVFVSAISSDGEELSDSEKETVIVDYMKDKKSPTEILTFRSLKIINLLFKSTATITNNPVSVVSGEIYNALETEYGILNTDFQTNVYESNYTCVIDSLENVLHHDTDLYHMEKNQSASFNYFVSNHEILVSNTSADDSDPLEQVYIEPGSTELWYTRVSGGVPTTSPARIGKDNGSSTIVGENGFTISGSNVDYNTNLISYTVNELSDAFVYGLPDTDYLIYIAYRTQNGNGDQINSVRLPAKDLITDMADEEYQQYSLTYV